MTNIKQKLSADEAAALVGRTKRTLYTHLYAGDIEATKNGPYWLVDRSSLLDYFNMRDPELPRESPMPMHGSGYPAYLGGNPSSMGPSAGSMDRLLDELSKEQETHRALMESNASLRVELAESKAREREADARAKAADKAAEEARRELTRLKEALYGTLRTRRDREVILG